jgi:hypothetical protein
VWGGFQLASYVAQAVIEATLLPLPSRAITEGEAKLTALAMAMRRYAFRLGVGMSVGAVLLVTLVLVPTSTFNAQQRSECYWLVLGFAIYPVLTAVSGVFSAAHCARGWFAQTALT